MPAPIQVELVPHSAEWAVVVEREVDRICTACGENVVVVHHIGSTAIPGILAKPIIDLMPEVRSLAALDDSRRRLEELGYAGWGEYGLSGRRYFTLDDRVTGRRRVQLHCFEAGSPQIERHLAFRDYLRAHPLKAREYEAEKQRCRELHPHDSHAYSDAKATWIETHLLVALAQRRGAGVSRERSES